MKNKLETFICICYSFGIILVVKAGGENNNKTLGGTKQSVVYSYSSVSSEGDGNDTLSLLTIARASDGKYHYVQTEGGQTKKGLWLKPLPETPDISQITAEITKDIPNNMELANLSSEIDTSIQDYLKKTFSL